TKLNPSDCRDDIPDCYNKDCTVDKIKFKCFKTCGFCNEVAMDGICKDEAVICAKMSRLCKQHYVGRLCRKTCNSCGKGQSANKLLPKENTPPESNKNILYDENKEISSSDCRDMIPDCFRKNCTLDKVKMRCFKTCGFCNEGTIEGTCEDEMESCAIMANPTLCEQHIVARLCGNTCNTCPKDEPMILHEPTFECEDTHKYCSKKKKLCKFALSTRENCPVTCDYCEDESYLYKDEEILHDDPIR
ncbi:unnamed protein product, partial [Meganyctiphanes norvegica]